VITSVALWVGLGGYSENSNQLEQTGTSADCAPDGTASYYAWYELVPANSVNVRLKIFPGDVITSSVVADGHQILVQVIDRTRGTRFTRRLKMATVDLTSAEWIAEAPSECGYNNDCRQLALTNFGAVNFSRTYAIGNHVPGTITSASWTATPIQLVPHSHRFFGGFSGPSAGRVPAGAAPLALAADGSGFGIKWRANAGTRT
jgi:peptidase A4-like protein